MGANAVTPPLPPGFEMDPPPPAGFVLDSPAAPPRGLGATPRTGFAAVPTAEEEATGVYTPPAQSAASVQADARRAQAQANPIRDKVVGAVEGALDIFAKAVGGTVGGMVGLVASPITGQTAEQGMQTGAERGVGLVRDVYRQTRLTDGQEPQTEFGQTLTEGFDTTMQNLPPIVGVRGTLPIETSVASPLGLRQQARLAAEPAARGLDGPTQMVRRAADAVIDRLPSRAEPQPTAGTKGSAGAAGVDMATQRRERAADMPVPLRITKGMATRDFEAQRFEKETAKDPETGKPLRERQADLGEGVLKNFEAFIEQTGASDVDAPTVGRNVVDPIVEKARKAKDEIRAAYNAADEAGETAEPVNYTPLRAYIEDQTPTQRQKLAPVLDMVQEQLQRNDPEGTGKVTLKALEDIRKAVRANAQPGTPNGVAGGELLKRIDAIADQGTGDLYRKARSMYAEYAAEFKNRGVIRDLINLKKGTSDRRVAFEDVLDRSVLGGTMDDVKNLRETLVTAGPKGEQAWKDVRGAVLERIKRETFSNDARDERGNKVPSSAKLGKLIDKLDEDGRLDFLFGKQGAAQLRDLREVVADIYTAPPGAVNTSGTASVLKQAVDTMLTFGATGVPVPALTALKAIAKKVKERQTNKLVREALGDDDPLPPSTRRPFEEPPTPPAPPPAAPRGTPPAGGAAEPIPVPKARELTLEQANAAIKTAAQPSKIPAGEARELSPAEAGAALRPSKRERELMSLRDEVTDAEVLKEIDAEIKAERKRSADQARGEEFLRLADRATDPELRARFEQRAAKLGVKREKIPVGEATEIDRAAVNDRVPTPDDRPDDMRGVEVTEIEPDVVEAVVLDAQQMADWQRRNRFGDLDAQLAQRVAKALGYDAQAVQRAEVQHARSPRAFEREIQRIVDEGDARASQAQQPGQSGQGTDRDAEPGASRARAESGPSRPDGDAATAADSAQSVRAGGQDGGVKVSPERLAKIEEAAKLAAEGVPRNLIDEAVQLLRQYDVAPRPVDVPPAARTRLEGLLGPLIERAERANGAFSDKVRDLAKRLGAQPKTAPVKSMKRSVEKLYADELETGQPAGAESIKDLVRASIVVPTEADVPAAVRAVRDTFDVIRVKDRFQTPMDTGYRDVLINVRLPDGSIGELQIHIPEMLAAKELGHMLYEIERVLPDGMERTRFVKAQSRFYGGAYEAARARTTGSGQAASSLSNAARSTGMSSSGERSTTPVTADRYPPPGERTTGNPSRSKNEAPGGIGNAGAFINRSPNVTILADAPRGRETTVITEGGERMRVLYRAVDVDQLVTSHDDALGVNPGFPPELQPRDRTRQASVDQISRMSNGIVPRLLGESPNAQDGAPIVGRDGVVESGNARTIALRRAYAEGKAEQYREWLIRNAERFGLNPDEIRAMKRPMVVRQGLGDYDRADFARLANKSVVSAMSETEQARSDAGRMPDLEGLEVDDTGTILQSRSAEFIRQFMNEVAGPSERNAMMTADGRLSQRGAARIRNAIFARAYGDPDIVAMLTEATDGNVKNILAGMLRASPAVARIRELIDAGARPPVQFVPDLLDAVRRFSRAREDGMKVDQALSQVGMFGDEASPRVAALMRELEDNARAPKRVAEMIQRFVDEIDQQGDPRQGGLFGDGDGTGSLADDLGRQQQFLAQRARASGFKDIDEWAAGDIEGFTKAAAEWRKRNPGGGGLMLVPAALGLGLAGAPRAKEEDESGS